MLGKSEAEAGFWIGWKAEPVEKAGFHTPSSKANMPEPPPVSTWRLSSYLCPHGRRRGGVENRPPKRRVPVNRKLQSDTIPHAIRTALHDGNLLPILSTSDTKINCAAACLEYKFPGANRSYMNKLFKYRFICTSVLDTTMLPRVVPVPNSSGSPGKGWKAFMW